MASLSKRAQARNERELHELLRVPGNSICADCVAKNPSWASWNLGIFLCMRCASLHRKLGTHISKVKSLSMDTWTQDQVDNMRKNGNSAVNKLYNPRNKRPDIPIDADEADSAMERFIRKKYQEKSLVDGRPEPPSRTNISSGFAQPPQAVSPPPQLPPKKHKFFGFGLRASSDKKKGEPRVDSAFQIGAEDLSPTSAKPRDVPELELQQKIAQLRDMGFTNSSQSAAMLQKTGGDLERTIALLVKLTPSRTPEPPSTERQLASAGTESLPAGGPSNNPYNQAQSPAFGLSLNSNPQQEQQQPQTTGSATNPWQLSMQTPGQTGLESQFQGMQVSNPLFPHSTGGHIPSQGYRTASLQTMTPPVPSVPQQYSQASSPTTSIGHNPFHQPPMSAQSTGGNPFYQQQAQTQQPSFAPALNPFFGLQNDQPQQNAAANPFGLPSPQVQQPVQQAVQSPQYQSTNPFGSVQSLQSAQTFPLTQQPQAQYQAQPGIALPNFNYGQPQQSQFEQQQQQTFYQQPQQTQQQPQQQQPFAPQQTGRYNKNDIMALFSQPAHYAQQPQLSTVPESYDDTTVPTQQISQVPSNNPYGTQNLAQPKRSVTMPAAFSNPASAPFPGSGGISNNPFFNTNTSRQASAGPAFAQSQFGPGQATQSPFNPAPSAGYGIGARHTSIESVSVNNPSLMDGRHSPDAFTGLSARYG